MTTARAAYLAARVGLGRDGPKVVVGDVDHDAACMGATRNKSTQPVGCRHGSTAARSCGSSGSRPTTSIHGLGVCRPAPEAALARPARCARSVVKASSGRSSLLILE